MKISTEVSSCSSNILNRIIDYLCRRSLVPVLYNSFNFLPGTLLVFFPGSCREKKDTEVHQLEGDRDVENNTLLPLEEENARLRREIDAMKQVKMGKYKFN